VFKTRLKKLEAAMDAATSYEEWKQAAIEHDKASGVDKWQAVDQSKNFDFASIRRRLDHLRQVRAHGDNRALLFTLNEGIHGNLGGMGSAALYGKTKFGTKDLIRDYVEEITESLLHLASPEVYDISFEKKLDFFRRASHCFGRSALMMSGSGTLLFFHLGVVKALWEQRLLPDIMSGSSGGAFVGAVMCASSDDELSDFFDPDHMPGKDSPASVLDAITSFISPERITAEDVWSMLEMFLPDYTFQEAVARTGRHMNVSVAPAEALQRSRLLNADTSPNVFMREAVLASTAFPGFFPPVTLMAKNDAGERQQYHGLRRWVDGSLSEDLPAKRLARLYGVNHYIVSQTNPIVIPFLNDRERKPDTWSILKHAAFASAKTWVNAGAAVLNKPLSVVPKVKRVTNSLLSVMNQSYVGDITILPLTKLHNPFRALSWRTHEEIEELMEEGERATWPQLERIRIQTLISRTLDPILYSYEEQHLQQYGEKKIAAL
jgi:TAG lipase/steryl ester hydrolase/phospholipase A2/LPA acyltransferase